MLRSKLFICVRRANRRGCGACRDARVVSRRGGGSFHARIEDYQLCTYPFVAARTRLMIAINNPCAAQCRSGLHARLDTTVVGEDIAGGCTHTRTHTHTHGIRTWRVLLTQTVCSFISQIVNLQLWYAFVRLREPKNKSVFFVFVFFFSPFFFSLLNAKPNQFVAVRNDSERSERVIVSMSRGGWSVLYIKNGRELGAFFLCSESGFSFRARSF